MLPQIIEPAYFATIGGEVKFLGGVIAGPAQIMKQVDYEI